jgi:hypothetical protein
MSNSAANNTCEFCNKVFVREKLFIKHLCEPKRRWLERDMQVNRYAHGAWKFYFTKHHPSTKKTDYIDFTRSPYYMAFMQFATYCLNTNVINIHYFIDYLISHKVPINLWCSDKEYSKFLIDYLKTEDVDDATNRSLGTLEEMCRDENIQIKDAFKFLNENRLCQKIYQGMISPWVLYNSDTAIDFLSRLNDDQVKIIYDYINPDIWKIKVYREKATNNKIKSTLVQHQL